MEPEQEKEFEPKDTGGKADAPVEEEPAISSPSKKSPSPVEKPPSEKSPSPVEKPLSEKSASPIEKPPSEKSASPVEKPPSEKSASPVEKPLSEKSASPVEKPPSEKSASPVEKPPSEKSTSPVEKPPSEKSTSPVEKPPSEKSASPVEKPPSEKSASPVEKPPSEKSASPLGEEQPTPTSDRLLKSHGEKGDLTSYRVSSRPPSAASQPRSTASRLESRKSTRSKQNSIREKGTSEKNLSNSERSSPSQTKFRRDSGREVQMPLKTCSNSATRSSSQTRLAKGKHLCVSSATRRSPSQTESRGELDRRQTPKRDLNSSSRYSTPQTGSRAGSRKEKIILVSPVSSGSSTRSRTEVFDERTEMWVNRSESDVGEQEIVDRLSATTSESTSQTRINVSDILDQYRGEQAVERVSGDEEVVEQDFMSEGSEDETELVVLDPDHPLMTRFQAAFKAHLLKQNERLTLALRELDSSLKKKTREKEDLGVELYGLQQNLAKHQMILEKEQDERTTVNNLRCMEEGKLENIRHEYRQVQAYVNSENKAYANLLNEVEKLALKLLYLENTHQDISSDISLMHRATQKAYKDVAKAEVSKQKQDLYVIRLVERVDKLREEIALYDAQRAAQSEDTKAAQHILMEANMETEAIHLEKRRLYHHWSSSLIGMKRRDEALAAILETLRQHEQKVICLDSEVEGFRKTILKEQELNEKLTFILNKNEHDYETTKKQLDQSQERYDVLKSEYSMYSRLLRETEQTLNRALVDKTLTLGEVNNLRKQIQMEDEEKHRLEDEIMEKIRTQLTLDKASKYTKKLTNKSRLTTKAMETQVAELENLIVRYSMDNFNMRTKTERLKKFLQQLDDEIQHKNKIINTSEAEIAKQNTAVERKQNQLDLCNKKLMKLIDDAGGVEVGPLEAQVKQLQKSIKESQKDVVTEQQQWLRLQNELVEVSKEKDDQTKEINILKKDYTILSQQKLRLENFINQQKQEIHDAERSISNMQNDMLKLNMLLFKKNNSEEYLKDHNTLMETDFIQALKQAEKESLELQARAESFAENKEKLLSSLVEIEQQIMLWEKKIQIAREMKIAVDTSIGHGEIRAMKFEIHRMELRHTQLKRQQELMIQDMEKVVSRRDTILTRGEAKLKTNKKILTKGSSERQMIELRKKIKQINQDIKNCDVEIQNLQKYQEDFGIQLENNHLKCKQHQSKMDSMEDDYEKLIDLKHKNLTELVFKQQNLKYYHQLKEGKYKMVCKQDGLIHIELHKQVEKMQTMNMIVDRLNQEFPHLQPILRKLSLSLSGRVLLGNLDSERSETSKALEIQKPKFSRL